MKLVSHAENVWSVERPFRLSPGLWIPSRTTVLRLDDGGLLVFSPVMALPELAEELRALGPVQAIIAPNRMHHLGLPNAIEAFPDARVFATASLQKKREDVRFTDTLTADADPLWAGQVDQLAIAGIPTLDELAFFHRASRTLLLGDLAFNVKRPEKFLNRWVLRLTGSWGPFGPSRLIRAVIRDKAAVKATVEQLIAWEPARILPLHGDPVEGDAVGALRRAFERL